MLLLLILQLSACSKPASDVTRLNTPTTSHSSDVNLPSEPIQPTITPTESPQVQTSGSRGQTRLWALRGNIDLVNWQNVAIGSPEDDEICGSTESVGNDEAIGEVILTLSYAPSIIPSQINLWLGEEAENIQHVEIMNSATGLGRQVYPEEFGVEETLLADHNCERVLSIPVNIDFEVDTVFISLNSLDAASRVDAVEVVGTSDHFQDALVYWRMPLYAAPVSVAVDPDNLVYVATEDNNIYTYDIEGNLLSEMRAVTEGRISDLVTDQEGNLLFGDALFGTYTIISPEGENLTGGGDAPTIQLALQPDNGKLFLLDDLGGLFYLVPYFPGTDIIINPLPLDDIAYTGLAFSPDNRLFTIRPNDGFLVELDPISGLEIYTIPLKSAEYIDAIPVEFSIDNRGTFYILFAKNEGNSAISVLESNGNLIRRAGALTWPVEDDWPGGSFHAPRSITVTLDGRFLLIADGDAGTYYLTCLMMLED